MRAVIASIVSVAAGAIAVTLALALAYLMSIWSGLDAPSYPERVGVVAVAATLVAAACLVAVTSARFAFRSTRPSRFEVALPIALVGGLTLAFSLGQAWGLERTEFLKSWVDGMWMYAGAIALLSILSTLVSLRRLAGEHNSDKR